MARFSVPEPGQAPLDSQPLLETIQKRLGFVPNSYRLLSLSPAVLAGITALQSSLSTTLDLKTRNGIALAVSEASGCSYCVAAHSYTAAKLARTPHEEIELNRRGGSDDPKRATALHFARRVLDTRGKVNDADLAQMHTAGFDAKQIVEVVALAVQFLFTNLMNNLAQSDIDFPATDTAVPS